MDNEIKIIQRLSEMLSCMMDFAAEGGASGLIGFRDAYHESAVLLDEADKAIAAIEESKNYQNLESGYSQDRA